MFLVNIEKYLLALLYNLNLNYKIWTESMETAALFVEL